MDSVFTEIRLEGQQQRSTNGSSTSSFLPVVLVPKDFSTISLDITCNIINQYRDSLLGKLLESGAILFRSFPLQTAEDFNKFALGFKFKELPYIGK